MTKNNQECKLEYKAPLNGISTMQAAKYFRDIQDQSPNDFVHFANLAGVGRRKAYYLANIDRTFRPLGVNEKYLDSIGWTKLQILSNYITSANKKHLLKLASTNTVHELDLLLRQKDLVPGTRCVILYLEPQQYHVVAKAILTHGGSKSGVGLVNKEAALAAALSGLSPP